MKRRLFVALAVVALATSSGCCRGWFIWPGHYPHNPSFSQCCEPPWTPDPFKEGRGGGGGHQKRAVWGRGSCAEDGQCQYNSCGIESYLPGAGCEDGCCGAPHGYPHGGGGMHPGGAYGGGHGMHHGGHRGMHGAPGMYGPTSPEGIPLQPAPDAMSAAQVAYPYYTNRGPRDFLMGYPPGTQPPSIGP